MAKQQMSLFETIEIPPPARTMYISQNSSEAEFDNFLQFDKTNWNVFIRGQAIGNFTDYEDMKVLKNELFIFDNDRKEYITKVPNNYRKFTLMMLQFKRYSHEII